VGKLPLILCLLLVSTSIPLSSVKFVKAASDSRRFYMVMEGILAVASNHITSGSPGVPGLHGRDSVEYRGDFCRVEGARLQRGEGLYHRPGNQPDSGTYNSGLASNSPIGTALWITVIGMITSIIVPAYHSGNQSFQDTQQSTFQMCCGDEE